MALNLWKLGGQATSYNPLPLVGVSLTKQFLGETVLMFKASSLSGSPIQIINQTVNITDVVLTSIPKLFVYSFNKIPSSLTIDDKNNVGDIIIEDIQLIEKPLPKLTINGISSDVNDWEQGSITVTLDTPYVLNNESVMLQTRLRYKNPLIVLSNRTYTFAVDSNYEFWIAEGDVNNIVVYTVTSFSTVLSFTTKNNTKYLYIAFRRKDHGNINTNEISQIKPMFNLGTIPTPYEPKRGERMVMPTPKKNLFADSIWQMYDTNTLRYSGATGIVLDKTRSFTVSCNSEFVVAVNNNGTWIDYKNAITFTPSTGTNIIIYLRRASGTELDLATVPSAEPQLEHGTTATPYEPYAVQLNPKPKVKVPKKNLFDGVYTSGKKLISTGAETIDVLYGITDYIPIQIGKNYTNNRWVNTYSAYYDFNKMLIGSGVWNATTTPPSNAVYYRTTFLLTDLSTLQIEEGSTVTPYESYQLVLPKAKNGLVMDGVSNYLQLPTMTMDSIEIDCLIEPISGGFPYLLDARDGFTNGYVYTAPDKVVYRSGFTKVLVNNADGSNIPFNQRVKIKVINTTPFTDNVTVFSAYTLASKLKGILYGVKCYLNGQVVASYDFTNPNNIVGDKILNGTAKNLFPSFEDSRWSLHSNFRVLGKDVGRLDAISNDQKSSIFFDTGSNKTYTLIIPNNKGINSIDYYNGNTWISFVNLLFVNQYQINFTTPSNCNRFKILLGNGVYGSGSYDFIKPQLYQLDGKEGTLYGSPVQLLKSSKRTLYRKR